MTVLVTGESALAGGVDVVVSSDITEPEPSEEGLVGSFSFISSWVYLAAIANRVARVVSIGD